MKRAKGTKVKEEKPSVRDTINGACKGFASKLGGDEDQSVVDKAAGNHEAAARYVFFITQLILDSDH